MIADFVAPAKQGLAKRLKRGDDAMVSHLIGELDEGTVSALMAADAIEAVQGLLEGVQSVTRGVALEPTEQGASLGEVLALYQGPESVDGGVPYAVALIDLDEGPRITAMLTDIDPEEVDFDMPVEMVVRVNNTDGERGPINHSHKFRPRLEARSRT